MAARIALLSSMVLILAVGGVSAEPEIEYGQKAELRGVTSVFIDAGLELSFRENAIALLKKELPSLKVVERSSEAEVTLTVSLDGSDRGHGSATMVVSRTGSKPNAVRVLAKYTDNKSSIFTKKLSSVLIGRFVRDYREANR